MTQLRPPRPLFPRRRLEAEINEELEFHIAKRIRDNIAAGMPPGEARAEALRRFGDVTAVRKACHRIGMERVRAERRAEMLDHFKQDVSYSLRGLIKRPGFAAVAILTLALGIGGTTAIFSIVDGVVLRPLPYKDPGRLALVRGVETGMKSGSSGTSYPDFVDFDEGNAVFDELAAWSRGQVAVTGSDFEPANATTILISHDLLSVLGVGPALGRGVLPEEDRIGGEPVVILSDGFWASRFASDPAVLGRTIDLSGVNHTVVGVMPPDFDFGSGQLYVALGPQRAEGSRGAHVLGVLGRMKHGINLEAAEADLVGIARRLEEQYPDWNTGRTAQLTLLHDAVVQNVRPALMTLLGAVGVVLLIVCANVANLLLARATVRQKEVAIRTALGARRTRLVSQMLTESLVLALVGGAIGVLLAHGGVGLLKALSPGNIPRLAGVGIDGRVLGFALLVALFTGILFGVIPALQASKPDLQSTFLKEGGRTSSSGGRPGLRQLLVVSEMAMAVVLVAAAGLFINSFLRLQRVEAGYTAENVLVAPLSIPTSKYPPDESKTIVAFYEALLERVRALPGVQSASIGYQHPLSGGWETSFQIEGMLELPQGERPEARLRPVAPGYFRTVGIPLLRGRDFTEHDVASAPGVVIINESFARAFFSDTDPIGHRLLRGQWWTGTPGEFEIIGVVGDVKMDGLTVSTPWAMYYPHPQQPFNAMNLVVRTAGDPLAMTGAVREQVWALDADIPVENVTSLEQIRTRSVAPQRFQTQLLGLFGILALALAATGIYGVQSYSVAQRTGEIGLRISLGAGAGDVLRLVVGQGMKLALAGLAIGLLGAFVVTRVISSLLFGVSPTDPVTFAAVASFLTVVALVASLVPALRAIRVDPVAALRVE